MGVLDIGMWSQSGPVQSPCVVRGGLRFVLVAPEGRAF